MAMETQLQTNIKLGKILIMCGISRSRTSRRCSSSRPRRASRPLPLGGRRLPLRGQALPRRGPRPISLDAMSLIMEGIRRKDEWRGCARSSPARARSREDRVPPQDGRLKPSSLLLRTYEAIDGKKTIEELASISTPRNSRSPTRSSALRKGHPPNRGGEGMSGGGGLLVFTARLLEEARKALFEGRYKEAMNLFAYADRAKPETRRSELALPGPKRLSRRVFFADPFPGSRLESRSHEPADEGGPDASRGLPRLPPERGMGHRGGDQGLPLPRNEALQAIRKLYERV